MTAPAGRAEIEAIIARRHAEATATEYADVEQELLHRATDVAEERKRIARLANLRKQGLSLESERLLAVRTRLDLTRQLAEAIKKEMDISAAEATTFRDLGQDVPTSLSVADVKLRISWQLSADMMPVSGRRFGSIEWRLGPYMKTGDNFVERERALLASSIETLKQGSNR
jgi:dsDNA-specific endonuclease/ATPase MutS2